MLTWRPYERSFHVAQPVEKRRQGYKAVLGFENIPCRSVQALSIIIGTSGLQNPTFGL